MAKEKKAKSQKKKPLKIILIVLAAIAGIGLIVLGVFAGSVFKYKKTAKNMVKDVVTETFRQNESSVIYDINGEEITAFSGIKEIYYVDGADIPDIMKQIFIITEDKDFYKHKGVDLSSIFRAAIANMKHKEITQGASTITQQLARNMFLTHEVSWERKITEMFVARELEKKFSKAQILEFYLNNIYFANGYYGVEAAAQGYFSKKVSDLSTSQLAFLASIPNNPAKYDPVVNFDKTMERRNLLLKQLFTNGYIDSLEYYSAIEEKIQLIDSGDDKIDYVETYIFYCATRALMEKDGFVFRNEFTSEEDEENYRNVYVSHYPSTHQFYRGPDRSSRKTGVGIVLCGHVHDKWILYYDWKKNILNVNVSVDVWDYKPVRDSQITEMLDFIFMHGKNLVNTVQPGFVAWNRDRWNKWVLKINGELAAAREQRRKEKLERKGLTPEECERRRIEAMKAKGLIK